MPDYCKRWLLINYGKRDSSEVLEKEEKLTLKVSEGRLPPILEIWIPSRECFVAGKNFFKREGKKGLIDKLKGEGIIPVIRSSGGEIILHDSTCLNFGLISPRNILSLPFDMGRIFTFFLSGIFLYLKKNKIPCYFGKTKVFCPGRYDILVEGKKIAGNALLLRKNFCLVHGTLFVNTEKFYLEKMKLFYPSIEDELTSLKILMKKEIKMEKVVEEVVGSYKKSLKVNFFTLPFDKIKNLSP